MCESSTDGPVNSPARGEEPSLLAQPWAVILCASLSLCSAPTWARSQGSEAGFSGRVETGVAYFRSTDRLSAWGHEQLDGLDERAEWSAAVPVVLFDLRYRFGSGMECYLETPFESAARRLSFGVVRPLGASGKLDVAALASPWARAWEDPYLIGVDRTATGAQEYGGRIAWRSLSGTGFGLSYSLVHSEVAHDRAGKRFSELRRSGWIQEGELGYSIPLAPGAALTPAVASVRGDLEGGAEAFRRYEARLNFRLARPSFVANAFVSAGREAHEEEHPLFGVRRRERRAAGALVLTLPRPFGSPRLYVNLIATYAFRNSRPDFFDAKTGLTAATLGYSL